MMRAQATFKPGKLAYTLLAVICAKKRADKTTSESFNVNNQEAFNFPCAERAPSSTSNVDAFGREHYAEELSDLVTAGQLEVHVLESPTRDELKQKLETLEPEIVHFQGEQVAGTDQIGQFELADFQVSSPDSLTSLFGSKLPEVVYLESSATTKLGEAFHDKGVPFVIFWKGTVTYLSAVHFRQALLAVLRSSATQIWSAFQLASASFRLHCVHVKIQGTSNGQHKSSSMGPVILGDRPSSLIEPLKVKSSEEGESSPSPPPAITIYDEENELPLLICAAPHGQDAAALDALEDGLNALLAVEVKGIRLLNRVSAPPPPSAASTLTRGVVTMRCDICTSSFARISLLVSGSAQTCFDDQMLEYSIKKDIIQRAQLVYPITATRGSKSGLNPELRHSASVACGASVMEIKFRSPIWVIQVLRQLAPELSFRSLAVLGIVGVQGFPVAAFQKEDADRILALRLNSSKKHDAVSQSRLGIGSFGQFPSWLAPPLPSRKRRKISSPNNSYLNEEDRKSSARFLSEEAGPSIRQSAKQVLASPTNSELSLVAAMKPVPHANQNRNMPFAGAVLAGSHNGWTMKVSLPNGTGGKFVRPNVPVGPPGQNLSSNLQGTQSRQTVRALSPAQILSLNSMPMKKHGCNRRPIHECSEEEFMKDVMQFLISRGHARLVPSTKLELFPDAILNGKRLDLYNLYREVASRGGFYVGNGINWKGQVFSKMHNHTLVNKMTGVGNTLKKHYETYLLEYELAHDDVDGECCILCHSSAAGDWVNCGVCGEWAHFGCDKRNGLGAFKEYAKTDGLEYICPRCTAANGRVATGRRKFKSSGGGYSQPLESLSGGPSV